MGLNIVKENIKSLKGEFIIESNFGYGTIITAKIPFYKKENIEIGKEKHLNEKYEPEINHRSKKKFIMKLKSLNNGNLFSIENENMIGSFEKLKDNYQIKENYVDKLNRNKCKEEKYNYVNDEHSNKRKKKFENKKNDRFNYNRDLFIKKKGFNSTNE
jgi:hypothetical protein